MLIEGEESYILHHRSFSETTLILDIFTRQRGRYSLIAKGAKRPKSRWRSLLVPFQPLLLSWCGRGDIKTLTQAEADGSGVFLMGPKLWCGLYLNELLMRLLNMADPHPNTYQQYHAALIQINTGQEEPALRVFERDLLQDLGYGLAYCDVHGADIIPELLYAYMPGEGFQALQNQAAIVVSGATILALATGEFKDARQLKEAKMILQSALQIHLNKPLQTKVLFKAVQQYF